MILRRRRSEPSAHLFRPGLTGDLGAGNFDYILIDCPPTLGTLTVNALMTVQEVLVPVEAHVMALNGLVQFLQTVNTDVVLH
jgi:cellulose biosynthesis protein BcsQ